MRLINLLYRLAFATVILGIAWEARLMLFSQ